MDNNKLYKGEIAFYLAVPVVMLLGAAIIGYCAVEIAMLSLHILKIA